MIRVSENVLINSKRISAIEMKMVNKKQIYSVVCGNKSYEITVPIEKFLAEVERQPDEGKQHHFAG